jgi:hypothetical protein
MGFLRRPLPFFLFIFSFLLLTACATIASVAVNPQPAEPIFVTPNHQPTLTPFQPLRSTPLPTLTSGPTATISPAPTETQAPPTLTSIPTDTAVPTERPTSPPLPTLEASARPQYSLSVLMDYAGHIVAVGEDVVYPNPSNEALPSIVLAVNPNLWNGVFYLQALSVNDQPWSNLTLAGQWLTVNLDSPLQQGETVKIGLNYQLTLPYSSAKFENFGYTNRQTNLIDWYPFVVPYQPGVGWILHDPYPYGENLVYPLADFRVRLSFADPANPPVVAASSPASLEDGALVYNLPSARNFTISASNEFLFSTADANGVTIYNYYFAEDASAAAMTLELTSMAVETYSARFGPYPHTSLSAVETDLNDGLETDGLYFLASSFYRAYNGTVRNNLAVISVHETAHQWWYGAVASDQALEPWLDEALATYSEHVFYETNYPDLVNWWWNWRIISRAGGYVDWRLYDTTTFQSYVGAVYFNGANFLHDLRVRIGDEAFFAFLQDYYARNQGRIASSDDFFAILDTHTSANYADLLRNYFYYR